MEGTKYINQGDGYNVIIPGNNNTINMGVPYIVKNLPPNPTLIHRKKLSDELFGLILNCDFVNLYGIGGIGKTSLVQLCVLDDYVEKFHSVVYIPVENNIKRDLVETINKNQAVFDRLITNAKLNGKVTHDYGPIINALNLDYTNHNKINILIFDINDNQDDNKRVNLFFDECSENFSMMVPYRWKVLLISHSKLEYCSNSFPFHISYKELVEEKNDTFFYEELFKSRCSISDSIDLCVKEAFFKDLFYSPLLINVASGVIKTKRDIEDFRSLFESKNVKLSDNSCNGCLYTDIQLAGKKKQKLMEYLDTLVSFKKLDYNQKIIVILFMLWPTKYIPMKVVCSFVHGYMFSMNDFLGVLYRNKVAHYCDMVTFDNEPDRDSAVAGRVKSALDRLVFSNIITRGINETYQMHGLIADVFRGQYSKVINGWKSYLYWFRYFRKWLKNDHKIYVELIDRMLQKFKDSDYVELQQIYVDCIVNNFNYIIKNDNHSKNWTVINRIITNKYFKEQFYKYKIAEEKDEVKKFHLLFEFGEFYNMEFEDLPSANIQYRKAIYCFENNSELINDYECVIMSYLRCAETDSMIDVQCYVTAYSLYLDHKNEISSFISDLFGCVPNGIKSITNSDENKADFYYRLGRFYENYYWEVEKRINFIHYARKLFKKADKLWASMMPENDGVLKGFVKTSYGIYDPEYEFKLVKVEQGSYTMGLTDEEMQKLKASILFDNERVHNENINSDFYIGMYPVTCGQWNKCCDRFNLQKFEEMEHDGLDVEERRKYGILNESEIGIPFENRPMHYVSAKDADDFIVQINKNGKCYRLPSEAEWEYAARGGKSNNRFLYSGDNCIDKVACHIGDLAPSKSDLRQEQRLTPFYLSEVGLLKPNELGIYDMSGNVMEWCLSDDCLWAIPFRHYPHRLLRGGSWCHNIQFCCVSVSAGELSPFYRDPINGFRLVYVSSVKDSQDTISNSEGGRPQLKKTILNQAFIQK